MRRRLAVALLGGLVLVGWLPSRALAHVEVVPQESAAGALERYGIRVPTEKPVPTIRVEVQFPDALHVMDIEAAPGWQVTMQTGSGGRPVGATWEGGSIPVGQFAEFALRAQNPSGQADLRWAVIQTYADGTEVQWVGPSNAEFPAATTRVRGTGFGSIDPLAGAALVLALAALLLGVLGQVRSRRATSVGLR